MGEARCEGVFPGNEAPIPMIQIKFPPFRAKSVHPSVNLPSLLKSLVNDLKVRRNEPQCSNLAFKVRSSQKSYGWNRFWSRTFDVKDENLC